MIADNNKLTDVNTAVKNTEINNNTLDITSYGPTGWNSLQSSLCYVLTDRKQR